MTKSRRNRRSAAEGRIRPVSTADVSTLVDVCRGSFPLSFRWQGLRTVAERWWRAAIATPAAETFVFECGGIVHGFCILVTDAKLWADQKAHREASLLPAVLSVLACPTAVLARVREKLAAAWRRNPPCAGQGGCQGESARTWIELIVVGPDMRGCGVARMLLEACEIRTAELEGKTIGLSVAAGNDPAIRLYEASGYVRTFATRSLCVYVKTLPAKGQKAEPSANTADRPVNLGNPA